METTSGFEPEMMGAATPRLTNLATSSYYFLAHLGHSMSVFLGGMFSSSSPTVRVQVMMPPG